MKLFHLVYFICKLFVLKLLSLERFMEIITVVVVQAITNALEDYLNLLTATLEFDKIAIKDFIHCSELIFILWFHNKNYIHNMVANRTEGLLWPIKCFLFKENFNFVDTIMSKIERILENQQIKLCFNIIFHFVYLLSAVASILHI